MKKIAVWLGIALCVFLIGRAIVEPISIDMSDPATYRLDWGGPSLAGVLAVHCVPGIAAAVVLAVALVRRRRSATGYQSPS